MTPRRARLAEDDRVRAHRSGVASIERAAGAREIADLVELRRPVDRVHVAGRVDGQVEDRTAAGHRADGRDAVGVPQAVAQTVMLMPMKAVKSAMPTLPPPLPGCSFIGLPRHRIAKARAHQQTGKQFASRARDRRV